MEKQGADSESDAVARDKKLQEEKQEVQKHTERLREQSIDKKARDVKQDNQRATEKKHDSVTKESRALDKTAIEASSKAKVDDKRLQDKRLSDKAADTKAINDKKTLDEAKAKKSQDVSEVPTAASGGAVTGSRSQLSALQSDLNRLKDRQEQLAKSLQQVYQTTGIVDAFRSMVLSSSIKEFPRIEIPTQSKDKPIINKTKPVKKDDNQPVITQQKTPTENAIPNQNNMKDVDPRANSVPIERAQPPLRTQQSQEPKQSIPTAPQPERPTTRMAEAIPIDSKAGDTTALPVSASDAIERPVVQDAPRVNLATPPESPLRPIPVDQRVVNDEAPFETEQKKPAIETPPVVDTEFVQEQESQPKVTEQDAAKLVLAENIHIDERTRQIYRELASVQQQIEEKQTQILKIQG
jgi:hypothetical protein